ncbi:MAG TPA: hypothetical protein VF054_02800 [Micromonosporaceae bacterium]
MRRHHRDGLSLLFGVIFLLVVVWWAVGRTVDVTLPTFGWFAALALIVVGALGLVGALRGHRHGDDEDRHG